MAKNKKAKGVDWDQNVPSLYGYVFLFLVCAAIFMLVYKVMYS